MNKSGYLINPNMFNAKFIYSGVEDKIRYDWVDGVWTQILYQVKICEHIQHVSCPIIIMDGCIDSYRWRLTYGDLDVIGIHMRDIILKDKVMKMLLKFFII
jgi:hypothetical protein